MAMAGLFCHSALLAQSGWRELGEQTSSMYNGIGYMTHDSSGNVYAFMGASVFKWDHNNWTELGGAAHLNPYVYPRQPIAADRAGHTYFLSGAKNAAGNLYVSSWTAGGWTELGGANTIPANHVLFAITTDKAGNVYVSGNFGPTGRCDVVKWDGSSWSFLGTGATALGVFSSVGRLAADDSGNVYASSGFTNASGKEYVMKWNGSNWAELGGTDALNANGLIRSLAAAPDGTVYAAGSFTNDSGHYYVARYSNGSWTELRSAGSRLRANAAMYAVDVDAHGNVYAAGAFTNAGGKRYVAKWNGSTWVEMGTSNPAADVGFIMAIDAVDSVNVYQTGGRANDLGRVHIAKWDGMQWKEQGDGSRSLNTNAGIVCLVTDSRQNLYAGGNFTEKNGRSSVAKWNDTAWAQMAPGVISGPPYSGGIHAVATDTAGNVYAAGGVMNDLGGASRYYVAQWKDTGWVEVGQQNELGASASISSIITDKAGNLYAAGKFANAAGYQYVAKWNGSTWLELGTGANALAANNEIATLAVDHSGNIYAAGMFTNSVGYYYVAKWDGSSWTEVVGNNRMWAGDHILSLATDTAGSLYAAGRFANAGGQKYVAKWDGSNWKALGNSGMNDIIWEINCSKHGLLYAVGAFTNSTGEHYVARWDGSGWSQLGAGFRSIGVLSNILSVASDTLGNVFVAGSCVLNTRMQHCVAVYKDTIVKATGVQSVPIGIREPLTIFPNPSKGQFMIEGSRAHSAGSTTLFVELFDMLGRKVYQSKEHVQGSGWTSTVQLAGYVANGIYQLRVTCADEIFEAQVIVHR